MIETVSGARAQNNFYMHSLESEEQLLRCVQQSSSILKLRVSDSYVTSVKTTVYRTALNPIVQYCTQTRVITFILSHIVDKISFSIPRLSTLPLSSPFSSVQPQGEWSSHRVAVASNQCEQLANYQTLSPA